MEVAAIIDRFAFNDSPLLSTDARRLYELIPITGRNNSVSVKFPTKNNSATGFAAGVGSVSISDDKPEIKVTGSDNGKYIRAGQWKVERFSSNRWFWAGGTDHVNIIIEQVMSHSMDDGGRSLRVLYSFDGAPLLVQSWRPIRREIGLGRFSFGFTVGAWLDWKPITTE
jgi:hypothetical protein